jgi:hypothetical protein
VHHNRIIPLPIPIPLNKDCIQQAAIVGTSVTPEPSTWAMVLTGLLAISYVARKKKDE